MKMNKTIPTYFSFQTLIRFMEKQVLRKREAGKYSAADQYSATITWLQKFIATKKPKGKELSDVMVEDFYEYLDSQTHLRTNSQKSYMSAFRAMFNRGVREKVLSGRENPFAGIILKSEKPPKRALSQEIINEIARMDFSKELHLKRAAELFIAAFLACGIPFIDLIHLTSENLKDGFLVYHRQKTNTLVKLKVSECLREMIKRFYVEGSKYLFPVLSEGKDSYSDYKTCLRQHNYCLKEIGKRLSTPVHLTSYVIRHTWASEALKNFIPVQVISQGLGHTSEKTTRCYLKDLDQSELDKANEIITESLAKIIMDRA